MLSKKNRKLVVKKLKTQHRKNSSKQKNQNKQKKINLRFTKLIKNYRNKSRYNKIRNDKNFTANIKILIKKIRKSRTNRKSKINTFRQGLNKIMQKKSNFGLNNNSIISKKMQKGGNGPNNAVPLDSDTVQQTNNINLQMANEKCLAVYDSASGENNQSCEPNISQSDYMQTPVSEGIPGRLFLAGCLRVAPPTPDLVMLYEQHS